MWVFWLIAIGVAVLLVWKLRKDYRIVKRPKTIYSINQNLEVGSVNNQNVEVGSVRWGVVAARDRGSILKAPDSNYEEDNKTTTGRFIEVTVEVENTGKITKMFGFEPTLIDNKTREFGETKDVEDWIPEEKQLPVFSTELRPGMAKQFTWICEVAKDAVGLKLKVEDRSLGVTNLINLGL